MSSTNNQSKDLYKIAAVEELSNETAATCSGGALLAFTGTNFTGTPDLINGPTANLGKFNNKIQSIVLPAKRWKFWTEENFKGNSFVLNPGNYYNLKGLKFESVKPLPN